MTTQTKEEKLIHLLETHPFQFAKTMPEIPHSYALRKKWASEEDFEFAVQAIRDLGQDKKFGRKTFTYFYHGGHKYWSMGAPLPQTILINRAEAS